MPNQQDTLFYRQQVEEILQQLKEGLGPFILKVCRQNGSDPITVINMTLNGTTGFHRVAIGAKDEEILSELDTYKLLKLMIRKWDDQFKKYGLGYLELAYIYELFEYRNLWAHEMPMGEDEAYRVSDTARLLLLELGYPEIANLVWKLGDEIFQRKRASRRSGPIRIKLEGSMLEANSLSRIYQLALVILYQGKHLQKATIPFATSKKRYLLAEKPIHPNGEAFRHQVEYKGYFLEAHKDRKIGINHLKKLVTECGLQLQVINI